MLRVSVCSMNGGWSCDPSSFSCAPFMVTWQRFHPICHTQRCAVGDTLASSFHTFFFPPCGSAEISRSRDFPACCSKLKRSGVTGLKMHRLSTREGFSCSRLRGSPHT